MSHHCASVQIRSGTLVKQPEGRKRGAKKVCRISSSLYM